MQNDAVVCHLGQVGTQLLFTQYNCFVEFWIVFQVSRCCEMVWVEWGRYCLHLVTFVNLKSQGSNKWVSSSFTPTVSCLIHNKQNNFVSISVSLPHINDLISVSCERILLSGLCCGVWVRVEWAAERLIVYRWAIAVAYCVGPIQNCQQWTECFLYRFTFINAAEQHLCRRHRSVTGTLRLEGKIVWPMSNEFLCWSCWKKEDGVVSIDWPWRYHCKQPQRLFLTLPQLLPHMICPPRDTCQFGDVRNKRMRLLLFRQVCNWRTNLR